MKQGQKQYMIQVAADKYSGYSLLFLDCMSGFQRLFGRTLCNDLLCYNVWRHRP